MNVLISIVYIQYKLHYQIKFIKKNLIVFFGSLLEISLDPEFILSLATFNQPSLTFHRTPELQKHESVYFGNSKPSSPGR